MFNNNNSDNDKLEKRMGNTCGYQLQTLTCMSKSLACYKENSCPQKPPKKEGEGERRSSPTAISIESASVWIRRTSYSCYSIQETLLYVHRTQNP